MPMLTVSAIPLYHLHINIQLLYAAMAGIIAVTSLDDTPTLLELTNDYGAMQRLRE